MFGFGCIFLDKAALIMEISNVHIYSVLEFYYIRDRIFDFLPMFKQCINILCNFVLEKCSFVQILVSFELSLYFQISFDDNCKQFFANNDTIKNQSCNSLLCSSVSTNAEILLPLKFKRTAVNYNSASAEFALSCSLG